MNSTLFQSAYPNMCCCFFLMQIFQLDHNRYSTLTSFYFLKSTHRFRHQLILAVASIYGGWNLIYPQESDGRSALFVLSVIRVAAGKWQSCWIWLKTFFFFFFPGTLSSVVHRSVLPSLSLHQWRDQFSICEQHNWGNAVWEMVGGWRVVFVFLLCTKKKIDFLMK